MKRLFFFLGAFLIVTISIAQNSVELFLNSNPDIEIITGNENSFELRVKQAIDHKDPSKGHFKQRVFLSNISEEANTVIVSHGYQCAMPYRNELSTLLKANKIDVEHRYFGVSIPSDSLEFGYLNLEQATADLHHIREIFSELYKNKWISTGISKGGSTTIFYRYFYPNDVDVSVPYVAPINREFEDKRIYTFLSNVGSDDSREKITKFQINLFERRKELLPKLKEYSKNRELEFTYMNLEKAFEFAILEYPFSFWQWGHKSEDIPTGNDLDSLYNHFNKISNIDFYSDKSIDDLAPHYYQSAQEMGYYGYEVKPFAKYLKEISKTENPHATFVPSKEKITFNIDLLNDINRWLESSDEEFIYINGALDTWSATAVPPSEKKNSLFYYLEGQSHGTARIKYMTKQEKANLVKFLEKHLDTKIVE